jgi:hypothetical protein
MKKLVLLCFGLVTLSAVAFSQGSIVSFGVHGNVISSDINAAIQRLVQPTPPAQQQTTQILLEDVYGLGLGGGIHVDFNLGIIDLRLSGDYTSIAPEEDRFKSFVQTVFPGANIQYLEGGRITMLSGVLNGKFVILPVPIVKPYITGGAGLANLTTTPVKLTFNGAAIPDITLLKDQTVWTYNAGGGIDVDLGGSTLFVEIKINWLMIEEGTGTFVPIATAGLTF